MWLPPRWDKTVGKATDRFPDKLLPVKDAGAVPTELRLQSFINVFCQFSGTLPSRER